MKCPHCEYEHGWSGAIMDTVKGREGGFFSLSNDVQMTRANPDNWRPDEKVTLFACPSCYKTFIDTDF